MRSLNILFESNKDGSYRPLSCGIGVYYFPLVMELVYMLVVAGGVLTRSMWWSIMVVPILMVYSLFDKY